MYQLDFRRKSAPARRDDQNDADAMAKAQAAVQSGSILQEQYEQLESAVTSFIEQTKTQATALLQQIDAVRSTASAQVDAYSELEDIWYGYETGTEPAGLEELYDNANTGDYESELDDFTDALQNFTG